MPIYDSSRNKEPPISNHAVHDRATARSLERHHQRLRMIAQQNIRPYNVGDGWSHSKPRYEHLTHNLKRAQLEGERYADISRDNQNLLRKIALMEQSAVLDPTEGTWEFAPGVRLNRFQVPVIDHCISLQPQMRGAAKVPESLNRGARKRELERITRENLGIVQRIQNCPPSEQTRLDALRAHAAKNERIRHRIRQPKLGLGFHSPSLSPSAETRLATPQLRGATAPAPSQMPRRVFTPAQVFAPFERRGEPVPSALLRDAAEGATELLVVRDHATAAPSLAPPSLPPPTPPPPAPPRAPGQHHRLLAPPAPPCLRPDGPPPPRGTAGRRIGLRAWLDGARRRPARPDLVGVALPRGARTLTLALAPTPDPARTNLA